MGYKPRHDPGARGILYGVFALARVKQDLLARLRAFGLADTIGAERMFPTLPTAVAAFQDWAAKQDRAPGPGAD